MSITEEGKLKQKMREDLKHPQFQCCLHDTMGECDCGLRGVFQVLDEVKQELYKIIHLGVYEETKYPILVEAIEKWFGSDKQNGATK